MICEFCGCCCDLASLILFFIFVVLFYFVGQHKVEFIPEIVGPILEMTLIPETGRPKHTRLQYAIISYTEHSIYSASSE